MPEGAQNVGGGGAGGGSWEGVASAAGNAVSSVFQTVAGIEARRAAAEFAAEGRSVGWSEHLDTQRYEQELAELDRRIQDEQRRLLSEGRRAIESEELSLLRDQRARAVRQRQREAEAIRSAQTRRIRIPGWGWALIGVGAIGGIFALVAWRAKEQE